MEDLVKRAEECKEWTVVSDDGRILSQPVYDRETGEWLGNIDGEGNYVL